MKRIEPKLLPHNGHRTGREMGSLTAFQSATATAPVAPAPGTTAAPTVRSLNEAAHKLRTPDEIAGRPEKPPPRSFDTDRDVVAHAGRAVLVLGALGVVYGDIGTSPLYTEQLIFTSHANAAHPVVAGVYGIVSLIFWALMVVVTIKYAGFIMRAHNRGDGGIMALTALLQRHKVAAGAALVTLGIFGAALFFGDGIIIARGVRRHCSGLSYPGHGSLLALPARLRDRRKANRE